MTEPCWPRETLKRYLSGAIDAEMTGSIEAHLAACPECEQTIVELEGEPDTWLGSLRELENAKSQGKSRLTDSPAVIQSAVAAARKVTGDARGPGVPLRKLDQIGAYQLIRQLGQGSMGQVFLARHTSLDKQVAIKLLFAHSPQNGRFDFVSRFQREMRAAGRLHHPAIASATDAGEADGTHYLVMEFIDGLDLSRTARAVGPLSIANACELMRQAALGLSHAHAEGIVHRDIKPSNMMLDTQGRLKILDFGLAQWSLWDGAAGELTTVGQLMGTLDYMAPEQAERTDGVDYRADLYALGATLFRLLTGRAPLAAAPNMTLLEKVRLLGSHTAPLLSSLRSDAPKELVRLVASLLSRQPADRPASAAHVAEALQPWCKGHQLAELLQQARERELASAVAEKAIEPAGPHTIELHPAAPQPATQMLPPKRTRHWLWATAACVPLLILAGVMLTLELQKGQLVIQSDVADVKVKLLRDGKSVEQLTIHPGAQSTRLHADKYEIIIDAPSDQVTVDKESFTLRQGETVVAIVKRTPANNLSTSSVKPDSQFERMLAAASKRNAHKSSGSLTQLTPSTSSGTVKGFESVPITIQPQPGFRAVPEDLSVERLLKSLEQSLPPEWRDSALKFLAENLKVTDGVRVNARLLAEARRFHYDKPLAMQGLRNPVIDWKYLDDGYLCCFSKCNSPDRFVDLLHTELLAGESTWVSRWLASLARADYRNKPKFLADEYVAATLEYGFSERFIEGPFKTLNATQRELWMEFLKKQLSGQSQYAQLYSDKFFDLLAVRSGLGRMAVLTLDPYQLDKELVILDRKSGQPILEEKLATHAKQVLIEAQGTPEQLAHAAYRLATTGPFVESWRDELRSALSAQLKLLNASEFARTFTPLPMRSYAPKNWQPEPTQFGEIWPGTCDVQAEQLASAPRFRGVRYTNSEVLAYLALVKRLRLTFELDAELVQLHARCLEIEKPLSDLVTARHEHPPEVVGGYSQEWLNSLPEPWRDLHASVWTAFLVDRAVRNLANEDNHDDSELSQALLKNDTTIDMNWADRDSDGRLSAEELKDFQTSSPVEDKNGDGSYDYEELLHSRRLSRQIGKELREASDTPPASLP